MVEDKALDEVTEGRSLAHAIADTVREPLIVLDADLRVIVASRSFYRSFSVRKQETQGRMLYELGNGQWDVAELRRLLEDVLPSSSSIDDYEIEREFPATGRRTMLLNARRILSEDDQKLAILLAMGGRSRAARR